MARCKNINFISKLLLIVSFGSGMLYPAKNIYSQQGHANCFVYHRIGDPRYPSTNISTETFRAQLVYLKDHQYKVLPLGEVIDMLLNNKDIPENTAVITIDDAYRSFYENGLAVLEEFGYPVTLFINTHTIGGSDFMSWKEVDDARNRGVEMGNHSHRHHHFLNVADDDKRAEAFLQDLKVAHEMFMQHTGSRPDIFSYPYGEYDKTMIKALKDNGYKGAAAQYSGVLYRGSDRYAIPRFPMGGPYATLESFISKTEALPLEITRQSPDDIRITDNPPLVQIDIPKNTVEINSLQCFIDGEKECSLEVREGEELISLIIQSKHVLHRRRTLYTITARSRHGKGWRWYSHVWVNTEVDEE